MAEPDKGRIRAFKKERERLNAIVLEYADRNMKEFWRLDGEVFRDGELPRATKELIGLVASTVLRCDDCISFHLTRCAEEGISDRQLIEALSIGLMIGGSITIPHVRRAVDVWEELQRQPVGPDGTGPEPEPGPSGSEQVADRFQPVLESVRRVALSPFDITDKLTIVCTLLRERVAHYDWVGFYLVDDNDPQMLVLGPYVGAPTEHDRIPFGRGVCGRAARERRTVVVQDVSREGNYLACSPDVRAELVVPVIRDGRLIGELDVDSHQPAPFGRDDRVFLEQVAAIAAGMF